MIHDDSVSNHHCLLFAETNGTINTAIVQDISRNGTYVNEMAIGSSKTRNLEEKDIITVYGKARFIFRYPRVQETSSFLQQYMLLNKLGGGHCGEVSLGIERSTGQQHAVKIFTKDPNREIHRKIGVFMSVNHPNIVRIKDVFQERDRTFLVLELAPEGDLFSLIKEKQTLTEDETRVLFQQLFQALKYLACLFFFHRMASQRLHIAKLTHPRSTNET